MLTGSRGEYGEYHREYSKVPHCRCTGTTAADADGRCGEWHERTAAYYRCGQYIECPTVRTQQYPCEHSKVAHVGASGGECAFPAVSLSCACPRGHARVLNRCTHVPALRSAADDSAADSAKPSHAVIAPPHLSVSAKAEPSTDPGERTPQPGRPQPAVAAGGAALVAIRAVTNTIAGHALRGITGATRRLPISHECRFALTPIRTNADSQ